MTNHKNWASISKWIEAELKPRLCNSAEFFYNDKESQSNFTLPFLYQPFDARDPLHWLDRGFLFDFLHTIRGRGCILLDFGPGDGWPLLILAPFVREVIGVDGSPITDTRQFLLKGKNPSLSSHLCPAVLEAIWGQIVEAKSCRLMHPSGKTMSRWMKEIGFTQVQPTHSGGWFADQLFKRLPEQNRPAELTSIDQLPEPLVKIIVEMEAPWTFSGGQNPMLTALK